ncbi:MAG: hypothetical protein M3198_06040 [Actinomycetota bacterium]|nr:hypothetical protein [Actinomycetota bacterium]
MLLEATLVVAGVVVVLLGLVVGLLRIHEAGNKTSIMRRLVRGGPG